MINVINKFLLVTLFFGFISCRTGVQKVNKINPPTKYIGWWIYGEEQNIFKDEATLDEWTLVFLNENNEDLIDLYIAVCEMEYFPMECNMYGNIENDTLFVIDFEITYIQGCEEE